MGTRKVVWLVILSLACAPVTNSAVLTETIRRNELQRGYAECMQAPAVFPAERKAWCLHWARYRILMWAWEDCSNDPLRECDARPMWGDAL